MNENFSTTPPKRWTLDGEPFDLEGSDLPEEDRHLAERMAVGEVLAKADRRGSR